MTTKIKGGSGRQFAFGSIDLNLIKVLYALAIKGNVTEAGNVLGLSQPTVSHALKRLNG
ncbi:helix-turn-helix domain-containing protein [Neorhizobium vignae]|uniref:LysR family transcriptional regulator n=1 Tax=Neorhizobium vignae TaxID=690585 RepID=UPI0009FFEBED